MDKSPKTLKTKVHGFGLSDIGGRKNNQDSFFCNDKLRFYLVADGVGGHSGGDFASLFTSQKMNKILDELMELKQPVSVESDESEHIPYEATTEDGFFHLLLPDGKTILQHALWLTNEELNRIGEARASKIMEEHGIEDEKERKKLKMGTTLIAVWFRGDQLIFMNVGDSRAYIIWEGELQRVTHDHSRLEDVIREGELTPEEAQATQKRNVITRCLGVRPHIVADFYSRPLYPGMRILLCSDGLYDILPQDEMLRHCHLPNLEEACRKLVGAAKQTGEEMVKTGKRNGYDNITAVLIDAVGYGVPYRDENESSVNEPSLF